jgi:hypothetical protein
MHKATLFLATLLSSSLLVSVAHAQNKPQSGKETYKWTDDKGVVHYGDHVPAEYSQREQRLLNSQGLEVGKKQAEMNPKEAAEYAAQQKEESRRKQHDMFLISTYPSVKASRTSRDVRLDQINGQITAAKHFQPDEARRGLKHRAHLRAVQHEARRAPIPDDLAEEMVRAMSELRRRTRLPRRPSIRRRGPFDTQRFGTAHVGYRARRPGQRAPKQ